ncbi:MAG: rhodoquinone biosynthesis methyltransferase RquA [Magnetococcus sp. DMHC-6]
MAMDHPLEKLSGMDSSESFSSLRRDSQSVYQSYRLSKELPVPNYLEQTYWWAYLHPRGVHFFERQWLVNLILWGNYNRLRDAALAEIEPCHDGNNCLQVACVYGDFTKRFSARLGEKGHLNVVDVAPVQLENIQRKTRGLTNLSLHHEDSTDLSFKSGTFDHVVVFFLLHEQPAASRILTVQEAYRVTRPGGKLIFIDYHGPSFWNPYRYIMFPILRTLEPFAMDLWREEIVDLLPTDLPAPAAIQKQTFFGGLYQKVVLTR